MTTPEVDVIPDTCTLNCRRWKDDGRIVALVRCRVCTGGEEKEPVEGKQIGFRRLSSEASDTREEER